MISNGFVINPDSRLLPTYKISPFSNTDIFKNRKLNDNFNFERYFNKRFPDCDWAFVQSGRDAIHHALIDSGLKKDDEVAILTTTGNFYISGCVTKEIEKVCQWAREITIKTKLILVNHEFGFPYENLADLKKYNLPIIEDCAHSFLSQNAEKSVGTVGDYIVFSLPKFFPIQVGGILCAKKPVAGLKSDQSPDVVRYIRNVAGFWTPYLSHFSARRIYNYNLLQHMFAAKGYSTRFELMENQVPGVFMFRLKPRQNSQGLKDHLAKNGIEASVFYREEAVYIPVHHRLQEDDLEFFCDIIINYLEP